MKNSFPKCDKHYLKKWACNANAKFIDYVLEKSFKELFIYMYV